MEINKNSWHARLYKMNYVLPDSLCNYFWTLIIILLTIPVCWVGYLIPNLNERSDKSSRVVVTVLVYFLLVMGYAISETQGYHTSLLYTIINTLLFTFFIILGVALVVSIIFAGVKAYDWVEDYYDNKKIYKDKELKQYVVVEWWKGFKNKYCPKIDWK